VIGLTLRNHDGLLDATKRPLAVMNPWGGARQYCEGNADQNCLEKSAARTFACRGLAAAPIGVDLLHVGGRPPRRRAMRYTFAKALITSPRHLGQGDEGSWQPLLLRHGEVHAQDL
jgi:hypothetical protein